jgi:plastocyanin
MILALAGTLGLVAASCGGETTVSSGGGGGGGGQTEDPGEASGTFSIEDASDHGAADLSGLTETSLELDDFYFEPTVLMGEAGQTVNIELENEGTNPHTFTLDDGTVDEELDPGAKVEVDVTFPDSGHLRFVCRLHEGGGMIGALSVEGDLGAKPAGMAEGSGGDAEDDGGGENEGPGY